MNTNVTPTTPTVSTSWISHAIHEQKRGLAKLLASENILVRHDAAETASFDVKDRTLTLPLWEGLSMDQYDLLIGHEVGHAKYTPHEASLFAEFATDPNFKTFVNVLEDIRIERLMQRAYPGLRPAFRRGYADFFANGPIFQRESLRDLSTYRLIDRLNLHAKIGAHVAVPFTEAERVTLARAQSTQSFTEVVALARELYHAAQSSTPTPTPTPSSAKGTSPSKGPRPDGPASTTSSAETAEKGSDDPQPDGPASTTSSAETAEKGSDVPQDERSSTAEGEETRVSSARPYAETDVTTSEALRAFTRSQPQPSTTTPPPVDAVFPSVTRDAYIRSGELVPIARLVTLWQQQPTYAEQRPLVHARLAAFDRAHASTIALMAQEFTRKQSAKLREQSRVSRTGVLHPSKLHAYRLRDDLFRQIRTIPKGKQHGLVVLLDGSGSMRSSLPDVYTQALCLALFAQRVRIPCVIGVFGIAEFALWPAGPLVTDAAARQTRPCLTRTGLPTVLPSSPMESQVKVVWDSTDASVPLAEQRAYLTRLLCHAEASNLSYRQLSSTTTSWLPIDPQALVHAYQLLQVAVPGAAYSNTPLVSGVVLVDALLRDLVTRHRVQKSTLVVLTDGGASDRFTIDDGRGRRLHADRRQGVIVRDPDTRTTYSACHVSRVDATPAGDLAQWSSDAEEQLLTVYRILRARYGTRVVGLSIVPTKGRRQHEVFTDMLNTMGLPTRTYETHDATAWSPRHTQCTSAHPSIQLGSTTIETLMAQVKRDGLAVVPRLPHPLYDCAMLIGSDALALEDDEFESLDTSTMSTAQIVRAFKKTQRGARSNRRLVQAIVPFLA